MRVEFVARGDERRGREGECWTGGALIYVFLLIVKGIIEAV